MTNGNLRLDIVSKPEGLAEGPQVGDVYPLLGGTYRSDGEVARYRVVVGIRRNAVIFLTFDSNGEVCGATQCGMHAIERRLPIGRVRNFPVFDVEWFP